MMVSAQVAVTSVAVTKVLSTTLTQTIVHNLVYAGYDR